ncbi:hypothetical protein BJY04DRAFT_216144 [Aspergillus karnatakaensis]|uniref:uncharacterized protein n=1 Tax=Aspergillus karnatakaensis TaxID=1810916 RepID=UPI003CCD6E6A
MSGTEGSKGRGLARRLLLAALDREEKGYPSATQPAPSMMGSMGTDPNYGLSESSETHAKRSTITRTDASILIPPSDKLLVFRALTGIDSAPALNVMHHIPRTAPNVGIYTRVVRAETKAASRYKFHATLINTCLSIQIVVAAALTALGAARGPHNAVTAFGAINTIVAGILTYLKGSGLPDRLKHYQNEWRNIREYIEQRERELCLQGCELDVQEEIQIIEQMYEGVKREIEATKSGGDNRAAGRDKSAIRRFFPSSERREQEPQIPGPARVQERPYRPNETPYARPTQQPYAHPNQQPYPHPNQPPYDRPNQQPYEHPNQQPYDRPNQQLYEHPNQQPYEHPSQQAYDHPSQQPYERPIRPYERSSEHLSEKQQ